ncbi:hypothetical protein IT779_15555 [Nocardia sp. NEAU-351]|uniref:VWA domain-containing protein n=1 Tax=Nocardia bovistercoris TaxID=2785916 RepID=A0A931IBU2_9NOCA|nr:hypothetical protein [Nocardia bovistercoris]
MTEHTPPIAGRDDLTVTIAPGAGHGTPAVFFPHRAAIELDGARLPVDPATVRPEHDSDRARYAGVWGALVHECAHAAHTRWQAPLVADPAVVDAAELLDESRIEAAQIRRRPTDRHWLRAASLEFVTGDLGGAEALETLPATPYAAGQVAALILARVDAGILTPTETVPALAAVEAVVGAVKLEALRAIWRQAHTLADTDTVGMLELGRAWVDLVGPPSRHYPDPDSMLAEALCEAIASVMIAVAVESARLRTHRPPWPEERTAARVLARALDTASRRERAVVKSGSVLPPGRVRMRGAVAREAQRAAGAIPTAEMFTRTTRKVTPTPPLRIGIACDVSLSMQDYVESVASAAWIMARAAHLATLPADTATITFGREVRTIVEPGTAPAEVTEFRADDYFEVADEAIDVLDGHLGLARGENTRLLVMISDGYFRPHVRARAQQRLDRLRAAGCAVLWLTPDDPDATPLRGATVHTLTDPAATIQAIARAATTAVRDA